MDLIVATHVLPRRDIAVHEAGHFVIGKALGLPVQPPVIAADRQSGFVGTGVAPLPAGTDRAALIATYPKEIVQGCAISRAAMCFAGYAAEARLCRSHWAAHRIIGAGTSDLDNALEALTDVGIEDQLFDVWLLARDAVDQHWHQIYEYAQSL